MNRAALLWNSVSGTVLYAVTVVASFVMSPFLVRHLGNGAYGFWELMLGLVGYLGILDLGVGPAVVRYVALARGQNDPARLLQVINTGFMTFLLAGLTGAVVVGLVAIRPALVFGDLPLALSESRLALALAAGLFLLTFTRATFTASLMGLQFHRIVNSVRVLMTIVQPSVTYAWISHAPGHALLKLAAVGVVGLVIENLTFATILMRQIGSPLNPRHARLAEGRELLGFGAKSMGIMAASSLVRQGLLFSLSHGLGAVAVTYYVLAGRLVEYASSLAGAIGFPMTPYLASAFGAGGVSGAREAWQMTTRVMQFLQAGIAMGVWWLGLPFLSHWMGPEYAEKGAPVFHFLAASLMLCIIGTNANRMIVSMNRHGRLAMIGSSLAVLAFAVSWWAIPRFGLAGAAACAFGFAVSQNLVEFVLVCRALQVSPLAQLALLVRRVGPPVAAGTAALWVLSQQWPATSYARLAGHGAVAGVLYLVVSFFSVLTADERRRLIVRCGGRGARAQPQL